MRLIKCERFAGWSLPNAHEACTAKGCIVAILFPQMTGAGNTAQIAVPHGSVHSERHEIPKPCIGSKQSWRTIGC